MITTLEAARQLGATHLPRPWSIRRRHRLEEQQMYSKSSKSRSNNSTPPANLRPKSGGSQRHQETLKKNPRIARYVGGSLVAQVESLYELGGQPFPNREAALFW